MKPSDRYVRDHGSKWNGVLEGVIRGLEDVFPLEPMPESGNLMMQQPAQQQQATDMIEGEIVSAQPVATKR